MKPMSLLPAALLALCSAVSSQAGAADHVSIHCKTTPSGQCEAPPRPPAAPSAAVPPVPPVPPAPPAPAPHVPPAPPAVPPAPPPPKLPAVPAAANAACASKAPGSALNWSLRAGETMSGTCERQGDRMRFVMQRYDLDD